MNYPSKKLVTTVTFALAAASLLAAPASAAVVTFATYSQTGASPGADMRWVKVGASGGELCATTTASCAAPGAVAVQFNFLQAGLSALGNLAASYAFDGTAAQGSAAQQVGGFVIQPNIVGTFSFTYTGASPLVVGATQYLTGANLLTATVFNGAAEFGVRNGTSGSVSASTSAGSIIVYTSDFLDFSGTVDRDFAINLTAESSPFSAIAGQSVNSFTANSGGAFSSDPAPIVHNGVPEPAGWALMITGFMGAGAALRRRRQAACAA